MNVGAPSTLEGPRARAVYVASCAGLLGFSFAFLLTATVPDLALPWYVPLERRWALAPLAPAPASMDFFGRVSLAAIAGVFASAAGFAVGRRPLTDTILRAVFVWALSMTLVAMFVFAWTLGTRVIAP